MDINSIDRTKLTDIQRRNLAALQLKQYEMRQQYGDRIQIINTVDEILSMTRPLTIPLNALDPSHQVSIMLEELLETPDGSVALVHERGEMPMAENISSVTKALEDKVDEYRRIDEMRTMRKRKKAEFQVPAGYKLVKIEDDPKPAEIVSENEIEAADTIGVAISKKPAVTDEDKNAAIKELLSLLV